MTRATNWPLRRGLVIVEVVILLGLNGEQIVRRLFPPGPFQPGAALYLAVGAVIGALALLRRRYPERTAELAAAAIALSLACSVVGFLTRPAAPIAGDSESFALMLLVGAGCHRLAARHAGAVAVLGGLVISLGPLLRYGTGSTVLFVAMFWAMLWACSVAVGLILRDGDTRREAALAAARSRERLALARELHDLVAYHITGVVVRTQAAGVVLADRPEREVLEDIERAGAEALGAVRRLVTMLRSPEQASPLSPRGLVEAVKAAVDDDSVTLHLAPGLARLEVTPETVSTVHRVVLEALTNVRKHAVEARHVAVTVEPVTEADQRYLRVEVHDDGLRPGRSRSNGGYGLVGMRERIAALDGRLTTGEHGEHGWRVLAELPLPGGAMAARPPEEDTAP